MYGRGEQGCSVSVTVSVTHSLYVTTKLSQFDHKIDIDMLMLLKIFS